MLATRVGTKGITASISSENSVLVENVPKTSIWTVFSLNTKRCPKIVLSQEGREGGALNLPKLS